MEGIGTPEVLVCFKVNLFSLSVALPFQYFYYEISFILVLHKFSL